MTKDELISHQAMKIAELEADKLDADSRLNQIHSMIYCIGGPLNDNKKGYTKEQMADFSKIADLTNIN